MHISIPKFHVTHPSGSIRSHTHTQGSPSYSQFTTKLEGIDLSVRCLPRSTCMSHGWRVRRPSWSQFSQRSSWIADRVPLSNWSCQQHSLIMIVAIYELKCDSYFTAVYTVCLHACSPPHSPLVLTALTWLDLTFWDMQRSYGVRRIIGLRKYT